MDLDQSGVKYFQIFFHDFRKDLTALFFDGQSREGSGGFLQSITIHQYSVGREEIHFALYVDRRNFPNNSEGIVNTKIKCKVMKHILQ